jgi:hypothetical protein
VQHGGAHFTIAVTFAPPARSTISSGDYRITTE